MIPAPGKLIDVGGRRLHVQQTAGESRPLVVFEAGIAASSVSWSLVQQRVGKFARTLSYDRAGFGWSDPLPAQATAEDAAADLARLLEALPESGEVVLVGHSFGGLVTRKFHQLWPERVAGLVLVDPVVRDEWRNLPEAKQAMLERGVRLSRRGATLARLGIVGAALRVLMSGNQTIPKLLAKVSAGNGAGVTDRLVGEVRKMPRELWPSIAQHWSQAQSFEAMARNLEMLPVSVTQLDESALMGDVPLRIISSGKGQGGQAKAEHVRDAGLSARGRCVVAAEAGHWVQLDDPDLVVATIREVVEMVHT